MPALNFRQIKKLCGYFFKRFLPISTNRGIKIRQHLAFLYVFVGWNAFIYTGYQLVKDKEPFNEQKKKTMRLDVTPSGDRSILSIRFKALDAKDNVME